MGCTVKCWEMPDCAVCGMRKHPRGRDPGLEAASGYCAHECEGHDQPPYAGHFWPGEEPEMLETARNKGVFEPMRTDEPNCAACGGSGFRGQGIGHGNVCDECGGQGTMQPAGSLRPIEPLSPESRALLDRGIEEVRAGKVKPMKAVEPDKP